MAKKPTTPTQFDAKHLKAEIMRDAKALGMAESTADYITNKIVAAVEKWISKRSAVTMEDIERRVAMEAERYNADLAYVYQNRGKII